MELKITVSAACRYVPPVGRLTEVLNEINTCKSSHLVMV